MTRQLALLLAGCIGCSSAVGASLTDLERSIALLSAQVDSIKNLQIIQQRTHNTPG